MITRILFIAALALIAKLSAAETAPEDLLRQGLFEEEANRDFDKAAECYRAVIAAHDKQRSMAASATFRLGEIARKKNDNEAAATAFRTVISRFPEQEDLARLSRENLAALGMSEPAAPVAETPPDPFAEVDPEDTEIARLKELARSSPDLIDGSDDVGWRPMHHAAEKGWTKVIGYLLANKAVPNSRTIREQLTPLHLASLRGHLAAVNALIAAKAPLDATFDIEQDTKDVLLARDQRAINTEGDWTALDLAVLYDRREIARALIAAGADLKRCGPVFPRDLVSGAASPFLEELKGDERLAFTSLQLAVELQRDEIATELLKAGAPLTAPDYREAFTPLQLAVLRNPDLTEAFLKAKADPKLGFPAYGITPLHDASNSGLIKAAKLLIDAGADIKAVDSLGRTPLHLAATAEMVEFLVAKGADPNARDSGGLTPVDLLVAREESTLPNAIEALFKHGATVVDVKALLQRTSLPLLPLVRERVVYPKEQRPDAILLSLGGGWNMAGIEKNSGGYITPMEIRPAAGSPPPSLAEGLWPFLNGNSGQYNNGYFYNLRILRRKNAEIFEVVLNWSPNRADPTRTATAWPVLEWGDIVELNCSFDSSQVPLSGDPFGKLEARSVLFQLESWTYSPDLTEFSRSNVWIRDPLGNISQDVARLIDRTHVSVIRKGVEKPIAVDLSQQMPNGFRLIDGDVVDLRFGKNFWNEVSGKSVNVINQMLAIEKVNAAGLVPIVAAHQKVLTDWSKVRILRRGPENASRNVDLAAWVRSLPPRDQWDFDQIAASDVPLQPGDVVMIPPSRSATDSDARKRESETSILLREVGDFLARPQVPKTPPK